MHRYYEPMWRKSAQDLTLGEKTPPTSRYIGQIENTFPSIEKLTEKGPLLHKETEAEERKDFPPSPSTILRVTMAQRNTSITQ